MGCSGEWDTVNERSLYHPSCKKGYAFLQHPLLKKAGSSGVIGSWPEGMFWRDWVSERKLLLALNVEEMRRKRRCQ